MLSPAATACNAIAVVVFVMGLVRAVPTRPARAAADLATTIRLAVEFLLAGGLLRLATLATWEALAVAAAIVLMRKLVVLGLGYAVRAVDGHNSAGGDNAGARRDGDRSVGN